MSIFDKHFEQLDRDLEQGLISQKEYQAALRDLREEARVYAEEQAERILDWDW